MIGNILDNKCLLCLKRQKTKQSVNRCDVTPYQKNVTSVKTFDNDPVPNKFQGQRTLIPYIEQICINGKQNLHFLIEHPTFLNVCHKTPGKTSNYCL